MKYVVDSVVTEGATSSGPHGISLSTTMDDDVFVDGTLKEAEGKSPDSQEEASERSTGKVSPGAVRQEVSRAITDKKGTLIILKDAEDKGDGEGEENGESFVSGESPVHENEIQPASRERGASTGDAVAVETQLVIVKTLNLKVEARPDGPARFKSVDSPKKAMASWISEESKPNAAAAAGVSENHVEEMKTPDEVPPDVGAVPSDEVVSERPKSVPPLRTLSESLSPTPAAVLYDD